MPISKIAALKASAGNAYADMSEAEFADRVYRKHYAEMPRAEFDARAYAPQTSNAGSRSRKLSEVMAEPKIYRVAAPDGRILRISAPAGASEADVLAYAQANYIPANRLDQIEQALRAADAAGNTSDARRLAQAYAAERARTDAPQMGEFDDLIPNGGRDQKPDFSNVQGGVQTLQRQRKPVPYNGPTLAPSRAVMGAPNVPTLAETNAANRAKRQAPGFAEGQARAEAANRRTAFRAMPAPVRFAAGMGQRVDGLRRGFDQGMSAIVDEVAPGNDYYQRALRNEAAYRQRDAAMSGDTAATLGGITGDIGLTFAPGGAAARLGGLRGVLASGAVSGAYGGLQPVVEGESRLENAGMGAAFGSGGQAVGAGLSAIGRNAARAVPAEIREMARRAKDLGIPVHASQVSQSLPVKVAASAGKYLPFSGYSRAAQAQQTGINRAVSKTFGAEADLLTDDVVREARKNLSAGFEGIYSRNVVPITEAGARRLARVEAEASRRLTRDQAEVLRNQLDDILANSEDGVLTGQKYQAVRSSLKKAEGNDKLGMAVRDLRRTLDDIAVEAVGPADAAALSGLRSKWANLRTVENVLAQNSGAGGNVRLGALWSQVRKGSTKEMRELARMGQTLLRDPISDSGTAQRTLAYNLLMGGGSIANPALIPMFVKAGVGGATVGRLANSSGLAQLLAREGRGAYASKLGGLLEGSYPYVAPAVTAYNERAGR